MFTDQPVTPVRLEVLLEVLARYSDGLSRSAVRELLQPAPLSGGNHDTADITIRAAMQLCLAEDVAGMLKLTSGFNRRLGIRGSILSAADENMLSGLDVEPHLALVYAYYLGLGKDVYSLGNLTRDDWASRFNRDVFGGHPSGTSFNGTRHTGIHRWMSYLGLGWYDPAGIFQAVPYGRLNRALPAIFRKRTKLSDSDFMSAMKAECPELDGGTIFLQANRYRSDSVTHGSCSLGLSHALLDLHGDGVLRLDCPVDSRGVSIAVADPGRDDFIKSDRITHIEYTGAQT